MSAQVRLDAVCPSHPKDGKHECMVDERRCVYCGALLAPETCNGCCQFISCADMHEGETRCEDCR